MAKRFKYYDIKHLLKDYPNAHYYVVFGERSNGKTYSALSYALERYVKNGEQFAYVRRFGEDIRKKNLSNLQMSAAAYRKEFCKSLYQTEKHCFKPLHYLSSFPFLNTPITATISMTMPAIITIGAATMRRKSNMA